MKNLVRKMYETIRGLILNINHDLFCLALFSYPYLYNYFSSLSNQIHKHL